jgi:hypothetical protein
MRKLILFLLCILSPSLVLAQSPYVLQSYINIAATGALPGISLQTLPVETHTLSWRPLGTVTTCTVAVDSSPDGTTWTGGGAIAGQTCTASGQVTLRGTFNFVRVNLTTLSGGGTVSVVYSGTAAGVADPCFSPNTTKSSAPFTITTATTTQLVAGVAGKSVYICGFTVTMSATLVANTFQITAGTGATCTTPTNLSGNYNSGILTTGATSISHQFPLTPSAAGQSVCAVTTVGTGPTIAGTVSYVQI